MDTQQAQQPAEDQVPSSNLARPSSAGPSAAAPIDPTTRPRGARGRACILCNKRKIRCKLSVSDQGVGGKCDNCRAFGYACIPYERKRKRYSIVAVDAPVLDPEVLRDTRPQIRSTADAGPVQSPSQSQAVPSPLHTIDFAHAVLGSQFGGRVVSSHPASHPADTRDQDSVPSLSGPSPSASSSYRPTSSPRGGYLGRSNYLGVEQLDHEDESPAVAVVADSAGASTLHSSLTDDDWKVLEIRKAFELPQRAVCESLISTFVAKCHLWMPVVPPAVLGRLQNGVMSDTPLILVQALLMAGSRMQTDSSPLIHVSTLELYNRAKVLFFSGFEKDPLTLVTTVTILQYWNPSDGYVPWLVLASIFDLMEPFLIETERSSSAGLHKEPDAQDPHRCLKRRIFWTLFARDSLLSTGQGRPRAIHLEDCTVQAPHISDFLVPDKGGHIFVAYVAIAGILGDLTQWNLRGCPNSAARAALFRDRLLEWVRALPLELHLLDSAGNLLPYDCDLRFLYLPYLTAIAILYKPSLPSKSSAVSQATAGSAIAASCVARIFEDALARNEVRNGVAMQAIYLLLAGICQLSTYDYPLLWRASIAELGVINLALAELSKTWQTAKDTLRILTRLQETVTTFRPNPEPQPLRLEHLDLGLFAPFGPTFAAKLAIITDNCSTNPCYRQLPAARDSVPVIATPSAQISPLGSGGGKHSVGHVTSTATPLLTSDSGAPELYGGVVEETSPPTAMADLLSDLWVDSVFTGEDWFLQNSQGG